MVVIPIRLLAATIIRAAFRGFPLDRISVFRIDDAVEVFQKKKSLNHVKSIESNEAINLLGVMLPLVKHGRQKKLNEELWP